MAEQTFPVAKVEISDIKIVEDGPKGIKSFVTYHIKADFADGSSAHVVRRYSDFEWLHAQLENQFKATIVPPIPEKDTFFRFSSEVVYYRRRQLGRFLSRLISHPDLCHSPSIKSFLSETEESFAQLRAAEPALTSSSSGVAPTPAPQEKSASAFFSSVFNAVSDIATNLTTDVQEVDSTFTDQSIYLEELREKLNILLSATTHNIQLNTQQVEHSVAFTKELENTEGFERKNFPQVSESLSKLKDTELAVADLYQKLVQNQIEMFEDALKDQAAYTLSVDRLLKNREEVLKQYQIAQATTKAKQEKVDSPQSTEVHNAELAKAKDTEAQLKDEFEKISAAVKQQLDIYSTEKSRQIRLALRELARENIEYGEQSIALWKDFSKTA